VFKKLVCVILFVALNSVVSAATSGSKPPNFLIILTDDQRVDTLTPEFMPKTWKKIVQQGILFENAFVTTPLCCPSRASILTGTLARHHGVLRNVTNSNRAEFADMNHFPEDLKNSGYFTGLVGKFLNSWKGPWRGRRKDEFDYWAAVNLSKDQYPYFNFDLYLNSQVIQYRCADPPLEGCEYITDELLRYSSMFLRQAVDSGRPFLLYFAPNAPHDPSTPAPRHAGLYADFPAYRPPSFAESDLSDKPHWIQDAAWIPRDSEGQPYMEAGIQEEIDSSRLSQLRSLAAVDEAVDTMLEMLKDEGVLGNTVILFTSDNGFYWGEHFLEGKNAPYEEGIRVPFAIRYPPLIPTGSPQINTKHMVANIDIAPTIYELAGIPIPDQIEGKSLVPLFSNDEAPWRKWLFFEGWPDRPGDIGDPDQCRPPFRAIRGRKYIYIRYDSNTGTGAPCVFDVPDDPELYNLQSDPYQLNNIAADPRYRKIRDRFEKRLSAYPKVDAPLYW